MGPKCQSAKDVCVDIFVHNRFSHDNGSVPKENQATLNEYIFNLNQNNSNTNNSKMIDIKPDPQFIDSYNAFNNFFHIITNVAKIQKAYKQYRSRIKSIKSRKDKEDINNNTKQASEEASDYNATVHKTSSSFLSLPTNKDEDDTIGKIKGYFLLKRTKYYHIGNTYNQKKQGFGIIQWEDGSKLKANFTDSKIDGVCHFKENETINFMGYYINNRPKGYGILTKLNEVSFEGEWDRNMQNGIGIAKWSDGTVYKGNFENSIKTSIGTLIWPDGTIYQGEFVNNEMVGYGMIFHSDKRKYCGQVLNGKMNGFGQFQWPNGTKYIGNYVRDKKSGLGIFYWNIKPLEAYIGFWKSGKQKGPGMHINNKTIKYGLWNDGKIDLVLYSPVDLNFYLNPEQKKYKNVFYFLPSKISNFSSEIDDI